MNYCINKALEPFFSVEKGLDVEGLNKAIDENIEVRLYQSMKVSEPNILLTFNNTLYVGSKEVPSLTVKLLTQDKIKEMLINKEIIFEN